jgi:hypothetical protein
MVKGARGYRDRHLAGPRCLLRSQGLGRGLQSFPLRSGASGHRTREGFSILFLAGFVMVVTVIRTLVAGCLLCLAAPGQTALPSEGRDGFEEADACRGRMNALVVYLEETAELEGKSHDVEWRTDGGVVLHYDAFAQWMWCDGATLHVECRPPAAVLPGD